MKRYPVRIGGVALLVFLAGATGVLAAESGAVWELLRLRQQEFALRQKMPSGALAVYWVAQCRTGNGRAEIQRRYFPLYERLITKFYDPETIYLEHDWQPLLAFSEAYLCFADSSRNRDWRENVFLFNWLVNKRFRELENLLALQPRLADADSAMLLIGAAASICYSGQIVDQAQAESLKRFPTKTIGVILWAADCLGEEPGKMAKLFAMLEANPNYVKDSRIQPLIAGLLHRLWLEEVERSPQSDLPVIAKTLKTRRLYSLLAAQAQGYIFSVSREGRGSWKSAMRKNDQPENDFVFEVKP